MIQFCDKAFAAAPCLTEVDCPCTRLSESSPNLEIP